MDKEILHKLIEADNACWLNADTLPETLPVKSDFLKSCSNYYDQIQGNQSPLVCPTIEQLSRKLLTIQEETARRCIELFYSYLDDPESYIDAITKEFGIKEI